MAEFNRKMAQSDGQGGWRLRVWRRKGRGVRSPRLLIKCGDCDAALAIYYGGDSMEIGGVHASLEEWQRIFVPLLDGRDPVEVGQGLKCEGGG